MKDEGGVTLEACGLGIVPVCSRELRRVITWAAAVA